MATQQTPTRGGVSTADPRRTARAPFPKRDEVGQDLKRLTERARAEFTRARLENGSDRTH